MITTAVTFPPIGTATILIITLPTLLLLLGVLFRPPTFSSLLHLYSRLLRALRLSPSTATGWKLSPPPGTTGWPYEGKTFRLCFKNVNTLFTQKTVLGVSCGMLLGMLHFWGITRPEVSQAGGGDGLVLFDLVFPLLMFSTTGVLLLMFLADSAKHLFAFCIPKGSATRHGLLLATLSCSGLTHLLLHENSGAIESGPAGLEVPLCLLILCFLGGLMLVFFGASANLGDFVPFHLRGRRAIEEGAMPGSDEGGGASAPPLSSIKAVPILVALSCAGLLQFLVPRTDHSSGSIEAEHELPTIFLFLSLTASLVIVTSKISA